MTKKRAMNARSGPKLCQNASIRCSSAPGWDWLGALLNAADTPLHIFAALAGTVSVHNVVTKGGANQKWAKYSISFTFNSKP
ncbi:protein of unknown function [Paraburkholderia dioscoreae]|uniref:Uncharacterized protein n=1 Tax=Paraburkholderia dioscoreae TaxID=2604047 RepID=A0A5Q4ZEV4_9BURK|nr:protein of unknown function [Paraburkholderia dioscoreae]